MVLKTILFLMQLPPPTNGVSIMNRVLVCSPLLKQHIKQIVVPISLNINMNRLGKFQFGKIFRSIGILLTLFKALIQNKPDAVYMTVSPFGYAFYRDFFYIALIKIFKKKLILHLHGKGIANLVFDHRMERIIFKFMFKNTYAICLSERLTDDIKPVHSGKVYVVNNGIEDHFKDFENPKAANSICRLLYLSNLSQEKGVLDYLTALKKLKEKAVPFQGWVVGAPFDVTQAELLEKIRTLGLEQDVFYLGSKYDEEKWAVFRQAHIFVLPTYYRNEAFPVSILEAMQFALPVISTSEGAIPDIVEEGVTGFLVKAKAPEEIAEKLKLLIEDLPLRCAMAKAAREKFEKKYTVDLFEKNMKQIFDEVLS